MKTFNIFLKLLLCIILLLGLNEVENRLQEINKTIGIFLDNVKRVEVWEKDNVYIDGTKVNGHCALVDAPCWTDFSHDTIKIK